MLSLFASSGQGFAWRDVLCLAAEKSLEPNTILTNSLVTATSKGYWQMGLARMLEMSWQSIPYNQHSLHNMVSLGHFEAGGSGEGYGRSSTWEAPLSSLQGMRRSQLQPDLITRSAFLKTLGPLDWQLSFAAWVDMRRAGISPNSLCLSSMLSSGSWQAAQNLYMECRKCSIADDMSYMSCAQNWSWTLALVSEGAFGSPLPVLPALGWRSALDLATVRRSLRSLRLADLVTPEEWTTTLSLLLGMRGSLAFLGFPWLSLAFPAFLWPMLLHTQLSSFGGTPKKNHTR